MTDTTNNFDPAPRLQQIAATIRERGAYTFDAPATAAYYIECAIKEIERLHRDYSCICNEMRRMMDERDEARSERDRARRLVCELQCDPPERFIGLPHEVAQMYGWDCFKQEAP
jgi:hypothetical protein